MATPGRNDACPCGSGTKYKKCCALTVDVSAAAARLHVLDEAVVNKLARLLRREGAVADDALEELRQRLTDDPELPLEQLLVPFMLYDVPATYLLGPCPLREAAGVRSIAAHFLAGAAGRFDARERSWIAAQLVHPMRLWEVTGVERGAAVELRDEESGETRRVVEKLASQTMPLRSTVLGRVIDFDGLSVFCGLYPRTLSPGGAQALRQLLSMPSESAHAERLLLAFAEAVAIEDARRAVPPVLQNTDGDPLLITTDHFSFPPSRRAEVIEALSKLDGCEPDDPSAAAPLAPDEEACAQFHFVMDGNPRHLSWDNTVLGNVAVWARALALETNSVRRSDALVEPLARALAGIAKRSLRIHEDPMNAVDGAPARKPLPRSEPMPPEAAAMIARLVRDEESAWPDRELPALDGKTPRKAVKTKKGRAAVELLLKEMEYRSSSGEPRLAYDFGRIRAALGL